MTSVKSHIMRLEVGTFYRLQFYFFETTFILMILIRREVDGVTTKKRSFKVSSS